MHINILTPLIPISFYFRRIWGFSGEAALQIFKNGVK